MKLRYKLPGGRKRLLRDWIAALRSGKYKQVVGSAEKDGGYCAIGLLSYVAHGDTKFPYRTSRTLVGIDNTSAVVTMNDSRRLTFRQIADWLEIQYVKI